MTTSAACKCETEKIIKHITVSKDEILAAINERQNGAGRPKNEIPKRRGPKDTRLMRAQRTALIVYVTVEQHKTVEEVTLADAYHVWHQPENVEAWNDASRRKDARRGYKDHAALYGVVKSLAEKRKLNLAKIIAV